MTAFFGDIALADVDIPMTRAYANARRAGKIGGGKHTKRSKVGADSTIRRELGVLSSCAHHAKKWKRINPTELPSIEKPVERSADEDDFEGEAKFFTREQIALLLFHAQEETRDILKLCYYTGARRGSIENLTAGQVDVSRRKINLATPGKRPTKKRQPVVPIFDEIRDDLKRLVAGKKPGDYLFTPGRFYHAFNLLCRALDFEEPHHPHMLRHSRATHLLLDGKGIYLVAGLLGDTVKTVEDNYGHHTSDELLEGLK